MVSRPVPEVGPSITGYDHYHPNDSCWMAPTTKIETILVPWFFPFHGNVLSLFLYINFILLYVLN
jgi:hypothetical protein